MTENHLVKCEVKISHAVVHLIADMMIMTEGGAVGPEVTAPGIDHVLGVLIAGEDLTPEVLTKTADALDPEVDPITVIVATIATPRETGSPTPDLEVDLTVMTESEMIDLEATPNLNHVAQPGQIKITGMKEMKGAMAGKTQLMNKHAFVVLIYQFSLFSFIFLCILLNHLMHYVKPLHLILDMNGSFCILISKF